MKGLLSVQADLVERSVQPALKRCEINLSTIICSKLEQASWSAMILNDDVSANTILQRATRHYTVVIKTSTTA